MSFKKLSKVSRRRRCGQMPITPFFAAIARNSLSCKWRDSRRKVYAPVCEKMTGALLSDSTPDRVSAEQWARSEEHTSELQSPCKLVCRLLLEKKNKTRSN